jgi:hypothetical protein
LAGSARPVATLVQVPSAPDSAQDLHAPEQVVAQQTPCAQCPCKHSASVEQEAASFFLPHELTLQTLGDRQLALSVHAVKHFDPLQVKGAQARVAGATHCPVVLHVAGGV